MNLTQLREYEKVHPRKIHQSSPLDDVPVSSVFSYDETTVAHLCRIGPYARHSACQATWCKCPCHEHGEMYGSFC